MAIQSTSSTSIQTPVGTGSEVVVGETKSIYIISEDLRDILQSLSKLEDKSVDNLQLSLDVNSSLQEVKIINKLLSQCLDSVSSYRNKLSVRLRELTRKEINNKTLKGETNKQS